MRSKIATKFNQKVFAIGNVFDQQVIEVTSNRFANDNDNIKQLFFSKFATLVMIIITTSFNVNYLHCTRTQPNDQS